MMSRSHPPAVLLAAMLGLATLSILWPALPSRAADPAPSLTARTAEAPAFRRGIMPIPAGPEPQAPAAADDAIPPGAAEAAWSYLVNNTQPATGLIDPVEGYHSATIWDIGSAIMGVVAAADLGLVRLPEATDRLAGMLRTLHGLDFAGQELPQRSYDVLTGAPASRDGWSAIDIGRALVALCVVALRFPDLAPAASAVEARWQMRRLTTNGELNTLVRSAGHEQLLQEGRLGYEQYAAAGYTLWGIDVPGAREIDPGPSVEIEGLAVPVDPRPGALLTSEPFVLAALELGGGMTGLGELGRVVFEVQRRHAARLGRLVALSEDSVDRPPWFIYGTIMADHHLWLTVDKEGKSLPGLGEISSKAAIGLGILTRGPYAHDLIRFVGDMIVPGRGVATGRFDDGRLNRAFNVNTNAVVLEALAYRSRGEQPLLVARQAPSGVVGAAQGPQPADGCQAAACTCGPRH